MMQNQPQFLECLVTCYQWASMNQPPTDDKTVSPTRDVFRARLDHFYKQMRGNLWSETEGALMTAVVGEIGNNCFDHNLGQWRDAPGCWFEWGSLPDNSLGWVLIADRGQGVRSSLERVDPSIQSDQQAIDTAFSKILSGRSPEKRGNGLKFVKQIVNGDSRRGLLFLSGEGRMVLGKLGDLAVRYSAELVKGKKIFGTWTLLLGEKS